ncbi:MAG: hypothetical protein K2I30_02800 [Clostridia bacterium]|nr:hypothetical protein [Clostridia bacterium]
MKKFLLILNVILSLGLLAVCAYVCAINGAVKNLPLSLGIMFAVFIVSIPLATALHELGHIIFGALAKISAKPVFKVFGSSCVKLKPRTDKNLKNRIIVTALGGLYLNLLCIILGVVALCVSAVPAEISGILPFSFYLYFLNSMPFEYYGGKTDGLVICELVTGEDEAKVMLAVLTVQAQIFGGKPIDEVNEKLLFDLPQIREDSESFIALTELRYEFLTAKGREGEAQKYKERFDDLQKYLN